MIGEGPKAHLSNPLGGMSGLMTVNFNEPELDSSRASLSSQQGLLSPLLLFPSFCLVSSMLGSRRFRYQHIRGFGSIG